VTKVNRYPQKEIGLNPLLAKLKSCYFQLEYRKVFLGTFKYVT